MKLGTLAGGFLMASQCLFGERFTTIQESHRIAARVRVLVLGILSRWDDATFRQRFEMTTWYSKLPGWFMTASNSAQMEFLEQASRALERILNDVDLEGTSESGKDFDELCRLMNAFTVASAGTRELNSQMQRTA